ncbi:hypothetical protein BDZ94DRAFT_1243321, partial [Collybia nuda]
MHRCVIYLMNLSQAVIQYSNAHGLMLTQLVIFFFEALFSRSPMLGLARVFGLSI